MLLNISATVDVSRTCVSSMLDEYRTRTTCKYAHVAVVVCVTRGPSAVVGPHDTFRWWPSCATWFQCNILSTCRSGGRVNRPQLHVAVVEYVNAHSKDWWVMCWLWRATESTANGTMTKQVNRHDSSSMKRHRFLCTGFYLVWAVASSHTSCRYVRTRWHQETTTSSQGL